jgi:hypothetical protein
MVLTLHLYLSGNEIDPMPHLGPRFRRYDVREGHLCFGRPAARNLT